MLVEELAKVTIPITAGTNVDQTVTFSGTVPSPPGTTPRGFPVTLTGDANPTTGTGLCHVSVNPSTTAQGQSVTTLELTISQ